jgi:hypothetical protein
MGLRGPGAKGRQRQNAESATAAAIALELRSPGHPSRIGEVHHTGKGQDVDPHSFWHTGPPPPRVGTSSSKARLQQIVVDPGQLKLKHFPPSGSLQPLESRSDRKSPAHEVRAGPRQRVLINGDCSGPRDASALRKAPAERGGMARSVVRLESWESAILPNQTPHVRGAVTSGKSPAAPARG